MSTVYFPASLLSLLCRKAARVSCLRLEKHPEGWSKSLFDPRQLLGVFPGLQLKPGYVLRAYQYRRRSNGNGVVWAMPENAPFPEPGAPAESGGGLADVPRPEEALADYMEAVAGDGSPLSYLSASLFAREAREFGAVWHGCSWRAHKFLGSDPWKTKPKGTDGSCTEWPSQDHAAWEWQTAKPSKWKPLVQIESRDVIVAFYTYTGLDRQCICQHVDRFEIGNYRFESKTLDIALGPQGFVY
jgi:hypothetical protein